VVRALVSPRMLLLHVAAVAAVAGAFLLGQWQYGVWHDHRHAKVDALANAAPRALTDVMGPDDPFPGDSVGRPVTFQGSWLPDDTVYVKGKVAHGRTGYWVVTPVEVGNSAMLVVRGWAAASDAPAVSGDVAVTGWLQPGEQPDENASDSTNERGDVLSSLQIADVLDRMDGDLYSGFVIARSPLQPQLVPVTPDQLPKPDAFTSIRNLLYGIEWWVFGAFALFLWWRWCADEVARVRSVSEAVDDAREPDEPGVGSSA
jgi:surfeit locus 1 family protein